MAKSTLALGLGHLGRHLEPQAVQADEAGGVALVVRVGRVGLHRRDVRVVKADWRLEPGGDLFFLMIRRPPRATLFPYTPGEI